MPRPTLSIVIPTHDTRELTLRCLGSLAHGGVAIEEIVVVDDASSDGTAEAIERDHPGARVVSTDRNLGFGPAANLGVERTSGEVVLVLNSDTEVLEGGFAALLAAFADDSGLGIGGAELLDPDGSPQWRAGRWPTRTWLFAQASGLGAAARRLPGRGRASGGGSSVVGSVDWVSGAALALRRQVWRACGPFDEGYRFYCQDLDLCYAAHRAGWQVAVVSGFRVLHHHGATVAGRSGASGSFNPEQLWADLVRFEGKHHGAAAARRAAAALRTGARLRLIGRSVKTPIVADRATWERETRAFRAGLDALRVDSSS